MRDSLLTALAIASLTAVIAGCGSGGGLTTGSIFGGSSDASASQVAAPKPTTPTDRALQVAAVSARAQRCGFNFDAEQLKQSYLASEAQAGTPPDQIQKVTKEYDYTRSSVWSTVARDDGYCTEGRAREVKASLTRHLAGDFTPPVARGAGGSILDTAGQGRSREVFNPDGVFDRTQKQTKRVEY
jgi:hypothetical protein